MGIFPTQGLNPGLPHCRWILYQLSHKGSPRILEWVAYPFSRQSSQPRDQTRVSCITRGFFTNWAIREAPKAARPSQKHLEAVGHGSEPDKHLLASLATLQMLPVFQNWALLTFHLWAFPVCGFDASHWWSFCAWAPVTVFQQLIFLHSPYLALVPAFQTHVLAVTSVAHRVTKRCLGQCSNHFPAPRPSLAYFISITVNGSPKETCWKKNLLHAWYFKDVMRKSV